MSNIESPCIKTCIIDNGLCKGCFRTLEEISQWRKISNKDKEKIIQNCERRIEKNDQ